MIPLLIWPPPYTLLRHPRSRSVRLKLCATKGLRLVVPPRFAAKDALTVIEQQRPWIEKTWVKVYAQQVSSQEVSVLTTLSLLAIDEVWCLTYLKAARTKITVSETQLQRALVIHGSREGCVQKALQRWLQLHAEAHLVPWLRNLSAHVNLPFGMAKIRHASSRWGSCNPKKTIMLNANLLFFPKAVVEYVMLHELCHTVHMNHGPHFWALLRQHNPLCQTQRQQLKQYQQWLPSGLAYFK